MTSELHFYYFSTMWKILKSELNLFIIETKKLDLKITTIFISSAILFTISWYFANPKFVSKYLIFHKSFTIVNEDLTSFSYWFILDSILFLAVPFLIVKYLFREKITDYGFILGKKSIGLVFTFFSILIFSPVIYFILKSENFSQYFPLMQSAKDDLLIFLIYELEFVLFIFAWEFIFRGFILFGLEKRFGLYAIFIQMIPFVILHNGKPFIETFASIFGVIFLGYLALRTRSILYGFFIHAIILVTLDVLSFFRG